MTTGDEKTLKEFLFEDLSHMQTAQAVFEAWPDVKNEVCQQFFDKLFDQIKQGIRDKLSKVGDGMELDKAYSSESSGRLGQIWLYRNCWKQYQNYSDSDRNGWTSVCLQANAGGPNEWLIGVASPADKNQMVAEDKARCEQLDEQLGEKLGNKEPIGWWLWYEHADDKYKNWDSIVPALGKELKKEEGGEIMQYFVDEFIEIAEAAIPIIDEIEKT